MDMPVMEFEPTIPLFELAKKTVYASGRAAAVIDRILMP
jgi:hypothetical protein